MYPRRRAPHPHGTQRTAASAEAADLAASQEVRSLQARVAAGEKRLEEAC